MWIKEDLLKSIWHAFTALDVDHRGKVSKSQLKVLSYNLCTVMKIPLDPMTLERHFKEDNEGPLSNQGYMPYLNTFILDKVQEEFDIQEFNKLCWTLCYKKNICTKHLVISDDDAFKVWCIFNFLSEDQYPLVMVAEEVEFFLRRLTEATGSGCSDHSFAHYRLQLHRRSSLSAWDLIDLVGAGFCKGLQPQTVSMGISEVFQELILDVVKQGYMMKKGHRRKNWTERWFVLRPNVLSYYLSEDLLEKKGDIILNEDCFLESLPDKEGKKCLFVIKCTNKTFEISAPDKKKRQEWLQVVQQCIQLQRLGLQSPHRESRQRRRELRQRRQAEQEEVTQKMQQLQVSNEHQQRQLEDMRKKMEEAALRAATEEHSREATHLDLQDRFRLDLEREKLVRQQMEEQVAQKSSELELYLQRVQELEDMYQQLQEALEDERLAKQDEEALGKLQARLLEEEVAKRSELERLHSDQQRALSQTEAEKQELVAERERKERELSTAMEQLDKLEKEQQGALQQFQEVSRKLQRATNKTKTWKDKVAKHEGLVRLIQPGHKAPQMITNWGPASFTEAELEVRKKWWQERKNQEAQGPAARQ